MDLIDGVNHSLLADSAALDLREKASYRSSNLPIGMFDTLAEIASAVALVLPGFLVVQLFERRRPSKPPGAILSWRFAGWCMR